MNINDRVILKEDSNKVGSIVKIEPMIQVRFFGGETCWHKESELTTVRHIPVGTWLQSSHKIPYYAVVTKIEENKHHVIWFTFNGQMVYYSTDTLEQYQLNDMKIVPCPKVEVSK